MDLHRIRTNIREEMVWWQMFQNNRFSSLILGTEYTLQDAHCNLTLGEAPPAERRNSFTSKFAILTSKVIDLIHTQSEHSYDAALSVDQELNHLASQMPLDYWKVESLVPRNLEEAMHLTSTLGGHSMFYQTKIILHMPYMLKAISTPAYEFSRNTCFDAARGAIRCLHVLRATESEFLFKHNGFDFLAFVGCITLILALFGYGNLNAQQIAEDWERIESSIGLFKSVSQQPFGKVAAQSYCALLQLTQFRERTPSSQDDIVQVMIPFFGTITVRRGASVQASTPHPMSPIASAETAPALRFIPPIYQSTPHINLGPQIAYNGPYRHPEVGSTNLAKNTMENDSTRSVSSHVGPQSNIDFSMMNMDQVSKPLKISCFPF
jgi:hypothetical protein